VTILKTLAEIEVMAEGGRRLGNVLQELAAHTHAGVTTKALDRIAYRLIHKSGARPAFLHYRPAGARKAYPYTLCASVNSVVVHGQPSEYVIQDGDLVKLDLGLFYKGFAVDAAITVGVGSISREAKKLVAVTEDALIAGIKMATLGHTLGDIGFAIAKVVKANKYSVVEGLTGHGIGRSIHEDPPVFNFGTRGAGGALAEGMVLAVEPMVACGRGGIIQLRDESYGTADETLAAHFEHTIAITKDGPRILTAASRR